MRGRPRVGRVAVVSVVEALERAGGVASRRALVAVTSRRAVDRAVAAGDVVVLARGRYALPVVDAAVREAHRLTATVSHLSAALAHGWEVKSPPGVPHVTVPRKRNPGLSGVVPHWADLASGDVDGLVTSQERTLLDCARSLPFDEALAVADSALRHGFGVERLRQLAEAARGPGSRQVRAVAAEATTLAANPFESVLRAVALAVLGLALRPQVEIWQPAFLGRVDLADRRLRIAVEADSYAWHGGRRAFAEDCRRYNQLAVHGWLVLRFSWEEVMHHPASVVAVLEAAVAEQAQRRCSGCRTA